MLRFTIRRLILIIPVLLGLTVLVFAIGRLLPGDPIALAAGPNATHADIERLSREFGFDQPVYVQYWHYLTGLLRGDWGQSIFTRRPVLADLAVFLPATLELVFAALAFAILIGVPAGVLAAVYRDRWPDFLTRFACLGAISMPRFFLGLMLQLGFAMALGWLPLTGRFPLTLDPPPAVTGLLTVDAFIAGNGTAFWTAMAHLALPALATALSPLASIARMMRASTIEVLQQDYVVTETALGLKPSLILCKYVFKNAFSATLTVIGLYVGWLLGGTVLVETVFDWPGIGLYATKSILSQDFTPVIGVTLMIGILFIMSNLLVDLLYGIFNPKVRYE
ncbi:MAG TPA: ABC transporter permease [Bordetella sp.]|jgi:peptide/nickel transport system permease protein|nr:ABC transporter permease [Bordetella sp.]